MKTTEGEETQREVEEEIARRGSSLSIHEPKEVSSTATVELNLEALDQVQEELQTVEALDKAQEELMTTEGEETQQEVQEEIARRGSNLSVHEPEEVKATAMVELNVEALGQVQEVEEEEGRQETKPNISFRKKMREKSWFGKKCVKIFKLFTNAFAMTFLAEWGDRSQLATIVMAGINDVAGVCLGGVLGHFICTGLAVICGALIAKKISVRMVTLVGALVFLGFAVASLFIDPYEENLNVPEIEGDGVNSTDFSLQSSFLVRDLNMLQEITVE